MNVKALICYKFHGEFGINLMFWDRENVIVENIGTSGSPARFNSWLGSQDKRKVDADFQAAREEKNWYSKLSVHNDPRSNICVISWANNRERIGKEWDLKRIGNSSKRLLSVSFPFAILSFHLFSSDVYSLIYNFSEFRGSTWGDGRRAESFPGLQHSQQVGQPFIFFSQAERFSFYSEHLLKNLFFRWPCYERTVNIL